jgi:hypothetical protein
VSRRHRQAGGRRPHLLLLVFSLSQRHRPPVTLDGNTMIFAQTLLQFLFADFFNGLLGPANQ